MKKEIEKLLKSKNATLKITNNFKLKRWQEDALGNKVDYLYLEGNLLYVGSSNTEIKTRTFKEIVIEIDNAIKQAYLDASEKIIKDIDNGRVKVQYNNLDGKVE